MNCNGEPQVKSLAQTDLSHQTDTPQVQGNEKLNFTKIALFLPY